MPLYCYDCPECGTFDAIAQHGQHEACPRCGTADAFDFLSTVKGTGIVDQSFEPYWELHASREPVYIDSAKGLDKLVKSKGLGIKHTARWAPSACRGRGPNDPPTRQDIITCLKDKNNGRLEDGR